MPATIYDVAKKAGVGIGTVSRAINNSTQIAAKTRAKVLVAIKELNYQPHAVAQSLARRKTHTIGCIIPFFTGYFFIELLRGIQRKITQCSYDLILYSVDMVNKKETFLHRALLERRVDGILLVSLEISDEYVQKFKEKKFPIVLLDNFHPELDSIKVDNVDGAYRATEHLIKLDYKKIAMINGVMTSFPAKLRFEGFKQALSDNRLKFEKRYFIQCDFASEADGFNKEAGYTAMKNLLDLKHDRPEAVFISSDIQAVGAIKAIKESGLKTPDDIAIVGFDDIELAEHIGLTTMRQPIHQMGELAVDRLIANITGKTGKSESDFKKKFCTELIIRDSCGYKIRKT